MKKEEVDKMTLQEACDYAVSKIVEQNKRCLDKHGNCVYGNNNGNHCGVGWLLDEEDPELMLAIGTIREVINNNSKRIPNLIKNNLKTMVYLQDFHDYTKVSRRNSLKDLSNHIDTSKPQYQKWLEMGFAE